MNSPLMETLIDEALALLRKNRDEPLLDHEKLINLLNAIDKLGAYTAYRESNRLVNYAILGRPDADE